MTDTSSPTPTSRRWRYPILATTGIAGGIAAIGAVLYLPFAPHSDCCAGMKAEASASQSTNCCVSMKDVKMPMKDAPTTPSTPAPPSTPTSPSMAPMPGMGPMPGMNMPNH
jgi:hypothetical protein